MHSAQQQPQNRLAYFLRNFMPLHGYLHAPWRCSAGAACIWRARRRARGGGRLLPIALGLLLRQKRVRDVSDRGAREELQPPPSLPGERLPGQKSKQTAAAVT